MKPGIGLFRWDPNLPPVGLLLIVSPIFFIYYELSGTRIDLI